MKNWAIVVGRVALVLMALLLFALNAYGKIKLPITDRLEHIAYDVRLRLTMPNKVDKRVVIVDVDEYSLQAEGQWPWSRDKIGRLVSKLFDDSGVRAVGFDITFPEPENRGGEAVLRQLYDGPLGQFDETRQLLDTARQEQNTDAALAKAVSGREVVLGFTLSQQQSIESDGGVGALGEPVYQSSELTAAGIEVDFVTATSFTGNIPVLVESAAASGFFDNLLVDSDGVFRRVPLVERYDGALYESLALALYRRAVNSSRPAFQFAEGAERLGSVELEAVSLKTADGDQRIPVDDKAAILVPYRGPMGQFPYISATDVLNDEADLEVLFDAIVLIGTTAPGLLDLRVTPVGRTFAGVEVHANIVSGLLDNRFLQRPSYAGGIELTWLFIVALLLLLIIPRVGAFGDVLVLIAAILATVWLNMWFWREQGVVIAVVSPLLFSALAFVLLTSYDYFIESRSKRKLSRFFGQYIPAELVAEMNASGQEISLDGQSRDMSVLFSDVRGFTTISESINPTELTQLMNAFLTPITKAIHDNRGTIDKYMGDAVMAFWGAPLDDQQHASHALDAGFEMLDRLAELQPQFEARGWPAINIGIGINSGEMNVGNMGSEFRVAYTVLGDAVNLGARLEGITKQYGVQFLVSEYTVAEAPEYVYRELDRVKVKGKNEPVSIYEPVAHSDKMSADDAGRLKRYEAALASYRQQQWDLAEAAMQSLAGEEPERMVYGIYLERIEQYRNAPPGEDWDGVFTHTTK